jgi:ADP-ribosylglycohydrolase
MKTKFTQSDKVNGLLQGAFVGDALALGPHWIYDRAEIAKRWGRITTLLAPGTSYHPGKVAGDYTHIGDQMLLLARSVSAHSGLFDADDFSAEWRAFFLKSDTLSYKDKATRTTLDNLKDGMAVMEAAAISSELAGPARAFPLFAVGLARGDSERELVAAAQLQTRLTHRSMETQETLAFVGRIFGGLLAGMDLGMSMDGALGDSAQFVRDAAIRADSPRLEKLSTGAAIEALGQACELEQSLAASILLLRRYEDNYEEAMIENVMAGGDSAARGILVGGILGYVLGLNAIPEAWRTGLRNPPPTL